MRTAITIFGVFLLQFAITFAAAHNEDANDGSVAVVEMDGSNWESVMEGAPVLLEMYAVWCGHCRRFAPTYERVADTLSEDGIVVGRVDGSKNRALSQRFGVTGFPSFYFVRDGVAYEFVGDRSADNLIEFARSNGESGGKKMSGVNNPFGPYWTYAGMLLKQWDVAVDYLEEKQLSTGVLSAAVAGIALATVFSFALIIHYATKPDPRS